MMKGSGEHGAVPTERRGWGPWQEGRRGLWRQPHRAVPETPSERLVAGTAGDRAVWAPGASLHRGCRLARRASSVVPGPLREEAGLGAADRPLEPPGPCPSHRHLRGCPPIAVCWAASRPCGGHGALPGMCLGPALPDKPAETWEGGRAAPHQGSQALTGFSLRVPPTALPSPAAEAERVLVADWCLLSDGSYLKPNQQGAGRSQTLPGLATTGTWVQASLHQGHDLQKQSVPHPSSGAVAGRPVASWGVSLSPTSGPALPGAPSVRLCVPCFFPAEWAHQPFPINPCPCFPVPSKIPSGFQSIWVQKTSGTLRQEDFGLLCFGGWAVAKAKTN